MPIGTTRLLGRPRAKPRSDGFTEREICLAGERRVVDRLLEGPRVGRAPIQPWLTSRHPFSLQSVGIEETSGGYFASARSVVYHRLGRKSRQGRQDGPLCLLLPGPVPQVPTT